MHVLIYAFVLLLAGTGILIAYLVSTTPVTNIGGRATTSDPLLHALLTTHVKASSFLMFLIVVHIAGALWHRLVRRDGVWEAMLPRFR